MSKFRSVHRTVVTEVKAFIVDTVSRSGVFRQSVSARVPDNSVFRTQDINVSKTQHFDLEEVVGVMGILSPEPVRIVMTQIREVENQEPIEPAPPVYTLAELNTGSLLIAGNYLNVSLTDPDIDQIITHVDVTAYNEDTGETDVVTLVRSDEQTFVGRIPTAKSFVKGNDFNGIMNVEHDQKVRIIYRDRLTPDGIDTDVISTILVESPFEDSVITSLEFVFPERNIPVLVEDADVSGRGTIVAQATNLRTSEVEDVQLTEQSPGIFMGQLPTRAEFDNLSNDGVMDVLVNDTIELSFTDPNALTSPTTTKEVLIRAVHPVNGTLTGPEIALSDSVVTLELNDYNVAGSSEVVVPISNLRTSEYELVKFTEAVPNTGQFIGKLTLAEGQFENNSGQLGVANNDTIQAVYLDSSSTESALMRVEHDITISVAQVSPAPSQANTNEESTVPMTNSTVEMVVDGLFFLNGQFPGRTRIYGLNDDLTRCSLLHV